MVNLKICINHTKIADIDDLGACHDLHLMSFGQSDWQENWRTRVRPLSFLSISHITQRLG